MSGFSVGAVGPTVPDTRGTRSTQDAQDQRARRRFAGPLPAALATLLAAAFSAGCGEDLPRCVTVDAACTPRYAPTFANLYNNTLADSCGSQSVACHSATGNKGGLSMSSIDVAFTALTSSGRVVAGDAACSEVVVRAHGTGESYLMPPGAPLPAADRCALEQWIAAGALREPAATIAPPSSSASPSPSSASSSSPAPLSSP